MAGFPPAQTERRAEMAPAGRSGPSSSTSALEPSQALLPVSLSSFVPGITVPHGCPVQTAATIVGNVISSIHPLQLGTMYRPPSAATETHSMRYRYFAPAFLWFFALTAAGAGS